MRTLLLIAMIAAVCGTAFGSSTSYDRTAAQMRGLSRACEVFREDYNTYPPQDSWLDELDGTSRVINRRRTSYIEPDGAVDDWGNQFVYRFPGKHNPDSFDLYSLGEDGKTETDGDDPDDIANWREPERWRKHYAPPKAVTLFHAFLIIGMGAATVILIKAQKRKRMSQV